MKEKEIPVSSLSLSTIDWERGSSSCSVLERGREKEACPFSTYSEEPLCQSASELLLPFFLGSLPAVGTVLRVPGATYLDLPLSCSSLKPPPGSLASTFKIWRCPQAAVLSGLGGWGWWWSSNLRQNSGTRINLLDSFFCLCSISWWVFCVFQICNT